MQKIYKYSQQIITGLVLLVAAAGVVFAAPSWSLDSLTSGFLRHYGHDQGLDHGMHTFYYGYGWSGLNQEWGYGYGYDSNSNEATALVNTEYGFEGDDGSATINSVAVGQTTATVTYSTNYLAKVLQAYALTSPVDQYNAITVEEESGFNSGERVWNITGLTCDTTYYYIINTKDAGRKPWPLQESFTTSACDTPDVPDSNNGPRVTGGSVAGAGTKVGDSSSSLLRLPPITLALGSVGIDVQDLQILLNHIGVFLDNHGAGSPGEETQYFGKKTYAAVKAFQQVFDLKKVDGVYGPETQAEMAKHLQ